MQCYLIAEWQQQQQQQQQHQVLRQQQERQKGRNVGEYLVGNGMDSKTAHHAANAKP